MLDHKLPKAAGVATLASLLFLTGGCAVADNKGGGEADYTAMSADELAEYLIFEKKGFILDQPTQEGTTVRARQTQDEIQQACSVVGGGKPGGETLTKVRTMAEKAIEKPEGGVKLGDWEAGEQVARSGYGFRVGHKTDDHSKRAPGGNCYACHQLDPDEIAYGTLGPSLTGYGKMRGTSQAMLDYTYGVISNVHAYFPCSQMPRFGTNGILSEKQIADVMAYLMAPESPVNQ